mgnify:CR=1 FL=1|tara:strand:+ start:359 stop:610 length:252 start_codon:yes stop_codon:yes gene_type:complete
MIVKRNTTPPSDTLLVGLIIGVILALCIWLCVLVYQTKQSTSALIQDLIRINATLDNMTKTYNELEESNQSMIKKLDLMIEKK